MKRLVIRAAGGFAVATEAALPFPGEGLPKLVLQVRGEGAEPRVARSTLSLRRRPMICDFGHLGQGSVVWGENGTLNANRS